MPRPSMTEADAQETPVADGATVGTCSEVEAVTNEAAGAGAEATADRVAQLRERLLREKLLQTPPLPRGQDGGGSEDQSLDDALGAMPVSEVDRFLAEDSNREALQSLRDEVAQQRDAVRNGDARRGSTDGAGCEAAKPEVNGHSTSGHQVKVKTVAKNSLFGAPAPQSRRASLAGASTAKNSLVTAGAAAAIADPKAPLVLKDQRHGRERSRDRRQQGRERSRDRRQHGRERSRDRRQHGRDRSRRRGSSHDRCPPSREARRSSRTRRSSRGRRPAATTSPPRLAPKPPVRAEVVAVRPAPERSSLRSSATGFLEVVFDAPSREEAEVEAEVEVNAEDVAVSAAVEASTMQAAASASAGGSGVSGDPVVAVLPSTAPASEVLATSTDPMVAELVAAVSSSSIAGKRAVRGRGTARYADGAEESATLRSLGGAEAEDNNPLEQSLPLPSRTMWHKRTVSRSRRRSSSCRRKRSRSGSRSRRHRSRSSSSSRRSRGRRKSSEERRKSRSRSRSRRRKGRSKSRSQKRRHSKSRSRKRKAHTRSRSPRKRNSNGRSSSRSPAQRPPVASQQAEAAAAAAAAVAFQPVVHSVISKEEQQEIDRFKPYSPVVLCNLIKNMELNGQCGLVVPQGCSITPDVPGCLKVRLEYGREVAVKPQNLHLLHMQQQQQQHVQTPAAMQMQYASQEQVLQQVLAQMQAEAAAQRAPPHVLSRTLGMPSAMV